MRLFLAAAIAFAMTGCASARTAAGDAQGTLAAPEPEPGCRTLLGAMLAQRSIDQVVVTVALEPDGRARVVRFLAPDLTPAQADDLRRAMGGCAWDARPDGGASAGEVTFVRREPRQAR